ncbi:hypothetical protein [Klebsiella pneumoniae]|uniref:hypothetical protein n=1 Tax=Klebsiella pneumoniae TaxID=573 RepID=UPI0035CE86EB
MRSYRKEHPRSFTTELKPSCRRRGSFAADGVEFEVIDHLPAGRNDNSASTTYYAAQSQTMRQNLINSCKAASGQTFDPIYLINQIGKHLYQHNGRTTGAEQTAEQADKTILVGSYQGLPNPGAHLCSNSYRWVASSRGNYGAITLVMVISLFGY